MNFRQRMAWVMVALYLAGTFALIWYVFEINEHYNVYALDHVQQFHPSDTKPVPGESKTKVKGTASGLWSHLADLPLPVWMLVLLLPYLQIFLMILACTRVQPKLSLAYLWPGLVYLKYQRLIGKRTSVIIPMESSRHLTNGYHIIHT